MKRTKFKGHEWDYYFIPIMEEVTDENGNTIQMMKGMEHRLRAHINGEKMEIVREEDFKKKTEKFHTEVAGDKVADAGNAKKMFDLVDPEIVKEVDPPKPKPTEEEKQDILDKIVGDVTKKKLKPLGVKDVRPQ